MGPQGRWNPVITQDCKKSVLLSVERIQTDTFSLIRETLFRLSSQRRKSDEQVYIKGATDMQMCSKLVTKRTRT